MNLFMMCLVYCVVFYVEGCGVVVVYVCMRMEVCY